MIRVEVNCKTGRVTEVTMSASEDQAHLAGCAERLIQETERKSRVPITTQLEQRIAALESRTR